MRRQSVDYHSGEMTINFDALVYKPGDRVNGWATVQLKVDFPTPKATLVVATSEHMHYPLIVQGKDESEQQGHFEEWQSYQSPYYFASYPVTLPSAEVLPAGNYVIPFTFKLPETAIQSFSHEWLQGGQNCYLRTSHKVYFLLENVKQRSLVYKKERFFVYRLDQLTPHLPPTRELSFQDTIKKGAFGTHGTFNFKLEVDKNEYRKGDVVRVRATVNLTQLQRKVVKIGCILAQNLTMTGLQAAGLGQPATTKFKPSTYSEVIAIKFQEAGPEPFSGVQQLSFDLPLDPSFDFANAYQCPYFACQHVVELILYFDQKPFVWTNHLFCLPIKVQEADNLLEVSNTKGPAITKAAILKKEALEGPSDPARDRELYAQLDELQHKKKGLFG